MVSLIARLDHCYTATLVILCEVIATQILDIAHTQIAMFYCYTILFYFSIIAITFSLYTSIRIKRGRAGV